jgi:hypothetical protein
MLPHGRKGAAMASFHLAVKAISRGAGRSATAAAAYRAGVEIEDERTGLVHDYTRKQGVEHQEIVAPDDAPAWARDRAALWNAAEAAERRKDAKVAREYEIALPAELDAAQRRDLALGFAREISNRYGVAVDVAIHLPGREGDHRNHHAHLLATTRRIGPEGMGAKTRELDVKATASVEVEQLRQRWAEMQNIALEQAGHVERVDHRTLKAQGIEVEPELKQGPAVTAMERKAKQIAQREGGSISLSPRSRSTMPRCMSAGACGSTSSGAGSGCGSMARRCGIGFMNWPARSTVPLALTSNRSATASVLCSANRNARGRSSSRRSDYATGIGRIGPMIIPKRNMRLGICNFLEVVKLQSDLSSHHGNGGLQIQLSRLRQIFEG